MGPFINYINVVLGSLKIPICSSIYFHNSYELTFFYSMKNMGTNTDYGRPMIFFFMEIQNFWVWADKFWGIFGRNISTHFDTVSPLSMFSTIQPLFRKKTMPSYPHPKYLFGIGIRIWTAKN